MAGIGGRLESQAGFAYPTGCHGTIPQGARASIFAAVRQAVATGYTDWSKNLTSPDGDIL